MEIGEAADLTADEPKRFGGRFERVEYTLQGRDDDYADHFRAVSEGYPDLAFVLTYSDPNADDHGSHLLLAGRQRTWRIPRRLQSELMRKHYTRWRLVDARGRMDYDAEDSDMAEWDAFFEMMDVAAAHWNDVVLHWLEQRHPGSTRRADTRRARR